MSEPRWLTEHEQAAWRAFLFANLLVSSELDHQLRRDSHLSHDYYGMLARLSEAPDQMLRMSDLAVMTASSPSRLTHAVSNLEKLDFVERRGCPNDRRVQYAVLTEAGRAALDAAGPGHVEAVRRCLFDALTDEQVEAMRDVMTTIARHLDHEVAERVELTTQPPAAV